MPTTYAPTVNWAGNVTFGADRVHRPGSVAELRRLVAGTDRIRALGSGHSFSRVADTTGDLVSLADLPPALELGPDQVTVAAGMTFAQVLTALRPAGLALANTASLPHISVAGSVATGTHGSGSDQPCLAARVRGLELVGPDGDLVTLSRDTDPDRLAGSVVALGALGIVTRVTLDVEPAYEVAQAVRLHVPLDEVQERTAEVFGAAYSVSAFTDFVSREANVWLKRRTDRPRAAWAGGAAATEDVHPVPGMPAGFSTAQLDAPGPWDERLPHFRAEFVPGAGRELQSEFYLPRDRAAEAIAALRGIGDRLTPVLQVSELRTVAADGLWLSPAYGRDCLTVHFTWIDHADAVAPVLAAVEELLLPLGARPHWGKLTALAPPALAALHPRAADFGRLVRAADPAGKFGNALVDGLIGRS